MHKRKLNVGSVIGTIVLGGLMIALLIYTATRTVHFLQLTFPPDMAYVAYLALAAFDGGIIGWTVFATSAAEGALQRGLAYLMIFVCTAGVILTTIADTTTISAQNGLTKLDPHMSAVGMWGSIAIIVLNVVAIIVTHLVAPHHVRKFELENVHDSIHQLTMQHIRDRAIEIAPRIAEEHADHWVRQTIQDVVGSLPASAQSRQNNMQLPGPKIIDADKSKLVYASNEHSEGRVDPYGVRKEVKDSKKIEKKPLTKLLKDAINFTVPVKEEKIEIVEEDPEEIDEEIDEDEEVYEIIDPRKKSPSKWTDEEWMILRDKVDAFAFADIWKMYKGDAPQPGEKIIEKKKGRGRPKKTGNQED